MRVPLASGLTGAYRSFQRSTRGSAHKWKDKTMKAIDRAAQWAERLEQVGFDVEAQTEVMWGNEYMTVNAVKGRTHIVFTIRMDTKFTRFGVGSIGSCGTYAHTTQVGKMSSWIFDWIQMEKLNTKQAVSA